MIRALATASVFAIGLVCVAANAQQTGRAEPGQGKRGSESSRAEQAGQKAELSQAERRFIEDAARANDEEVRLGELAKSKGQADDVKRLGQRMVDDHGKANDELKALAEKKGVTLPAAPSAAERTAENHLSKVPNDRFDQQYLGEMTKNHRKDIAEFERLAKDAKDPDVRAFAQKTLPVLQEHERLINQLRKQEVRTPGGSP